MLPPQYIRQAFKRNPDRDGVIYNLAFITRGEMTEIVRRRSGLNKRQQAAILKITRREYDEMEGDHINCFMRNTTPVTVNLPEDLTLSELLYLARKRSGLSIADIACDVGVTTASIYNMEKNKSEKLKQYWEGRGFYFADRESVERRFVGMDNA